jgi:hypothetical protein
VDRKESIVLSATATILNFLSTLKILNLQPSPNDYTITFLVQTHFVARWRNQHDGWSSWAININYYYLILSSICNYLLISWSHVGTKIKLNHILMAYIYHVNYEELFLVHQFTRKTKYTCRSRKSLFDENIHEIRHENFLKYK